RALLTVAGIAALALPLASCASLGSSGDKDGDTGGKTTITFLTPNNPQDVAIAEALIKAFTDANPDIVVKHTSQPAGTEGDNLNKTKLATGEMEDVFYYNSGSLFQALDPDKNLVALDDQPWVNDLDDSMKTVVSTENGIYGAPIGATQAGAVMYNKKVYAELGLTVPSSWAEFA